MSELDDIAAKLAAVRDEAGGMSAELDGKPSKKARRSHRKRTASAIAELAEATRQLAVTVDARASADGSLTDVQRYEIERRDAINRIWTARHLRRAADRATQAAASGFAALRSVFLVNGAGVVALLTFLGADRGPFDSVHIRYAFGFFVIGLILSLLGMAASYLAQLSVSNAETDRANAVYQAVIENEPERASASWLPVGVRFQGGAVALGVASLLFFALGAFAALNGIFES
jgi:hypothetical protein